MLCGLQTTKTNAFAPHVPRTGVSVACLDHLVVHPCDSLDLQGAVSHLLVAVGCLLLVDRVAVHIQEAWLLAFSHTHAHFVKGECPDALPAREESTRSNWITFAWFFSEQLADAKS